MNGKAIQIEDLHKTFKSGLFRRRAVAALRGVSLEVDTGSIFGLLGPNGAGKTTLIKILLGIVRKSGGQAFLLGTAAGKRAGRKSVGFLPENHRIPHHLTGNTALEYYGGLSNLSRHEIRNKIPALLDRVGLNSWGTTPVKNYSKGMMQRLGLAQAMIHDPELLILDEPTDGVDPVGRTEMRAILQELKDEGKTIFVNSHLLQEIELVCDRVAIMAKGKLRRIGTIEEITNVDSRIRSLTVAGQKSLIEEALADSPVEQITTLASGLQEIRIRIDDQSELDKCVDMLRQREISIKQISHPRATLEGAFLDIIDQLDDDPSDQPDAADQDPGSAELDVEADLPAEPGNSDSIRTS